jgi:hypothetical protein
VSAPALRAPTPAHHARPLRVLPAPPTPYTRTRAPLGDPTPLACTVAKNALEVALGLDGLEKLNRWVTGEIRAQVAKQHSLSRRGGYEVRGTVGIMRVRVHRVSAKAAEVCVIAREGERVHPIAMRLEDNAGRWLVTALELG